MGPPHSSACPRLVPVRLSHPTSGACAEGNVEVSLASGPCFPGSAAKAVIGGGMSWEGTEARTVSPLSPLLLRLAQGFGSCCALSHG